MKSRAMTNLVRIFVLAAAMFVVTLVSPALSSAATLWCGAGYGLTPDVAISGAIDDAQISAASIGQFNCTLVGEPEVFLSHNPYRGTFYSASVTMSCN